MSQSASTEAPQTTRGDPVEINKTASKIVKGTLGYVEHVAPKFKIQLKTSRVCVIDKATKTSAFRLDKAHRGVPYNHININPKISGLAKDPYIWLPPGGYAVGRATAKVCQTLNKLNKVILPVAIALDAAAVGTSVVHDVRNGTCRNTIETVAGIAGGFGGAACGATLGASIGTLLLPGLGTIIGGIVGSLSGGIAGSNGAESITEAFCDEIKMDIIVKKCKSCGEEFEFRAYKGESDEEYCEKCRHTQCVTSPELKSI